MANALLQIDYPVLKTVIDTVEIFLPAVVPVSKSFVKPPRRWIVVRIDRQPNSVASALFRHSLDFGNQTGTVSSISVFLFHKQILHIRTLYLNRLARPDRDTPADDFAILLEQDPGAIDIFRQPPEPFCDILGGVVWFESGEFFCVRFQSDSDSSLLIQNIISLLSLVMILLEILRHVQCPYVVCFIESIHKRCRYIGRHFLQRDL